MKETGFSYSSKYYSELSVDLHKFIRSKGDLERIRKIVELVGENKVVLDLGCFNGDISIIIKKNNNKVYGLDASESAIKIANELGIIAKVGNLENPFSYEDNNFDICVCAEVIEHILDTDFFIEEIKRVLKPNGYLIITTPNVASLGRRMLLLLGKNPFFEASFGFPSYKNAGHIRYFTKDLLINFLDAKGFKTIIFTSNVVNFNNSGNISSKLFAKLFPTLGSTLIIKAQNMK